MSLKDVSVAYFSMEIGLEDAIPTYAGGLGILAGDTLKSCADLKVPIIGITLLYKKGYFRQRLEDGVQHEEEVEWSPEKHMQRLSHRALVEIEGRRVEIGVWMYSLKGFSGHEVPVLFLDTDLPENSEQDRMITRSLYGKDERYRLAQEVVLGIGGVKILDKLNVKPKKYHLNEGHSSLLGLELSKRLDLESVRRMCVFTTHTPVPAGHDQFSSELASQVLKGEDLSGLLHDGRLNMTYLGLHFSEFINGVAKKHSEVSRTMFPGYRIESITNGVHHDTWTAEPFKRLFDKYIAGWREDPYSMRYILGAPRDEIWEAHAECKNTLITYVNNKFCSSFSADIFTIGFARRATAYKRPELLLSDIERLSGIARKFKGIQIIFAGKAHPKDEQGKQIIKQLIDKIKGLRGKLKACYLEDYGMEQAKLLVSGVDLWLNTPQRPLEASGTSGMKACHNGVPQFSVLDGWWLEGHIEGVTGWSIGQHPDEMKQTKQDEDAEDLYDKLEYIILPKFYKERGEWMKVMAHSIAINASFFNTHRMVQQYITNAYFK